MWASADTRIFMTRSSDQYLSPGVAQNQVPVQFAKEKGEEHWGQVVSFPRCSWGGRTPTKGNIPRAKVLWQIFSVEKQCKTDIRYNPRSSEKALCTYRCLLSSFPRAL